MYCKQCGKQIAPGRRFCAGCGASIGKNGTVPREVSRISHKVWIGLSATAGIAVLIAGGAIFIDKLNEWKANGEIVEEADTDMAESKVSAKTPTNAATTRPDIEPPLSPEPNAGLAKTDGPKDLAELLTGFQAAFYAFIDRYRVVPGDMSSMAACKVLASERLTNCPNKAPGGDENGLLDDGANRFREASALWAHLSAAGFVNGHYVGGAQNEASYSEHGRAPSNSFNGYIMLTRSDQYQDSMKAKTRGVLFTGRGVPVGVLADLDTRIDDGVPTTGVLRAATNGEGAFQGLPDCVVGGSNRAKWNVFGNATSCAAVLLF